MITPGTARAYDQHVNDSRPRSVVGGFVFPRPGRYPEWGYLQWPLAKLVVSDELLVLGARGALAKLKKPLALHFNEIERIETRTLPRWPLTIIISMRLRLADPAFDRT